MGFWVFVLLVVALFNELLDRFAGKEKVAD